jgi:hypothetical protein
LHSPSPGTVVVTWKLKASAEPGAAWTTSHFARPQVQAVPCLRDVRRNLGSLWELGIALVGECCMLSGYLQRVAERGD